MIKLSVVIPTYNRRHILQRTLTALNDQDLSPNDFEVIVVVDGSTDGTAESLSEWKPNFAFRILQTPNRGPSAARNLGARAATGDILLLLDDDLIAIPSLLRQHCAAHSGLDQRVVHGQIYVASESSRTIPRYYFETGYAGYYLSLDPKKELRYPEDFGPSIAVLSSVANSSMPRDVFIRCGGFDEEIRVSEDMELGLRLWKMGAGFRFLPDAIVNEYYVKTSREYLRWQERSAAIGDLRVCRKHPEYRPFSFMAPIAETPAVKKWLRHILMAVPVSPAPLLAFPLRFEKWFYRFTPLRRAGLRLLQVAERVIRLRGSQRASGSYEALESEFGRHCLTLMYHHVGPWKPGTSPEWTVSPRQFERQIRWLARRGYVGIRPSDWLRWRREGVGLSKKSILITFDDAYADIDQTALPILKRYGFGAAVFVVSGRIGGTNTWDEAQGSGTLQLMTAEQIRYWSQQGIEFGAHGRTHADLTRLPEAECLDEIAGSRNDLVDKLGLQITSFSYPFGEFNDTVRDIVGRHFELGFCSIEGFNYLKSDPQLLRRVVVGPSNSIIQFALLIYFGGFQRFRNWRIKLAFRTRIKKAFRQISRLTPAR
jgi:glycosyltransferase involved in cell wall biosynthesis/peptidoglycan/xylan/chitin deacetylase (PgdA/CDA1 family)